MPKKQEKSEKKISKGLIIGIAGVIVVVSLLFLYLPALLYLGLPLCIIAIIGIVYSIKDIRVKKIRSIIAIILNILVLLVSVWATAYFFWVPSYIQSI